MNEPLSVQEAPASYQVMLHTPRIKQGYKQTEVGVIPEDWDVVSIGSLGTFSKGQGVRKDESASGEIPCIRYGEIYTHHNDIVREFNSFISVSVAKSSKRLKNGDLLFAGSGETKEEIGKCVVFSEDIEAYAGGDIVILSPIKGYSLFFGYLFNTPTIVRQKASKGQGDAVVHISATALSSIKMPLPPSKAEQLAIATALSDVDALLAAQDKLIAKKRDIKQAAMQQLLTGKQRLPGFTGEWEVKRLGDVASVSKGTQLHSNETDEGGKFAHLNGGITPSSYTQKSNTNGNTIAISEGGNSCGFVQFMTEPYWCGGHCYSVIPNGIHNNFIYHALKGEQSKIMGLRVGSGLPNVQKTGLLNFKIQLPATLAEQNAIATILSDMDADLTALEQQRDKTRALKQGMMQALLTGKIRLVSVNT